MTFSMTEPLPEFKFWHDLSAFNRLSTAIWVFDIEDHKIWWGNKSALKFFGAKSLVDLVGRDFSTDSSSVRRRLHEMFETTAQGGDRVEENWTLYPNGMPQMVILTFTPIYIESRKKALLIEGTPQVKDELDHRTKRILEAVRHTPLMISTFDEDGSLLAQNPAAANAYNIQHKLTTIEDRYNNPDIRNRILDRHDTHKRFKRDVMVYTASGERCHTLTAEMGLDPVSGRQVIVATEEDITERVRAQEDLRRLNLNLEQRVAERTYKLTIAREEAESANKSKGNFLATMSHELRTPLNAIIGFSDMLGHQIYGPVNAKQTAALKDIHYSAQHLLELINELLDASTIDSGELNLFEEYFQHEDIVDYCQAIFELEAMKKDQTLIVENNVRDIAIKGDSRRFRQILINLLSNAVKYTHEGGSVSLSINSDADKNLLFQIKDTGIGIDASRLPDICKAFTQAASSSWAAGKGVGLGLYIASRLIDAHDGKLTITSEVNLGTTVKVLIPSARIRKILLKQA